MNTATTRKRSGPVNEEARQLARALRENLRGKGYSVGVEVGPGFVERLKSGRRPSVQRQVDREGDGPDAFVREESSTTRFSAYSHGGFGLRVKDDPDFLLALDGRFKAIAVAAQRELAQLAWVLDKMKVLKPMEATRGVFETTPKALGVLARAVFEEDLKGVEMTPLEVEHVRLVTSKFAMSLPARTLDKKLLRWAGMKRRKLAVGDREARGEMHTLVTDRLRHHKGMEFTGGEFDMHRDKVKAYLLAKVAALTHDPAQTRLEE